MSLDLVILGDDGRPQESVHLNANVHLELVGMATDFRFPKLSKMKDYYSDAEYALKEHENTLAEIQILLQQSTTEELRFSLHSLEKLVLHAIEFRRTINVLAD